MQNRIKHVSEIYGDFEIHVEVSRRTCVNCEHFDQASEFCALAGSRPPAKVIAYACEHWLEDIPF